MITEYTIFGKTKKVKSEVHYKGKPINSDTWEETLWTERPEDFYALLSPQLKNKKTRVIRREDWVRGYPV